MKKSHHRDYKPNLGEVRDTLAALPKDEREDHLKKEFPEVYCKALKQMKRYEEHKEFCRESVDHYTIYCLDYLEPMLENLRKQGKLKKGEY